MIGDATDTQALMAFLQSGLEQLEAASGAEDSEARMLLQQLEQQAAVLQSLAHVHPGQQQQQQQAPVMDELQLAEQLDSLDLQLSQLEASVAAADAPTLQLLGQSTSRWMPAAQATGSTVSGTALDPHKAAASQVSNSSSSSSSAKSDGSTEAPADGEAAGGSSSSKPDEGTVPGAAPGCPDPVDSSCQGNTTQPCGGSSSSKSGQPSQDPASNGQQGSSKAP